MSTTKILHSLSDLSNPYANVHYAPAYRPSKAYYKMLEGRKQQELKLKENRCKRNEFPDWHPQMFGMQRTMENIQKLLEAIFDKEPSARYYLRYAPKNQRVRGIIISKHAKS